MLPEEEIIIKEFESMFPYLVGRPIGVDISNSTVYLNYMDLSRVYKDMYSKMVHSFNGYIAGGYATNRLQIMSSFGPFTLAPFKFKIIEGNDILKGML